MELKGFDEASKEYRKTLAYVAVKQLSLVEELLSEIIGTYTAESTSAAHPKSGVMQTLKRIQAVKKEVGQIK